MIEAVVGILLKRAAPAAFNPTVDTAAVRTAELAPFSAFGALGHLTDATAVQPADAMPRDFARAVVHLARDEGQETDRTGG